MSNPLQAVFTARYNFSVSDFFVYGNYSSFSPHHPGSLLQDESLFYSPVHGSEDLGHMLPLKLPSLSELDGLQNGEAN